MRQLRRLLTFLIALVLIVFSVLNRHDVSLIWGPGQPAFIVPLYILFFAGIFFGLFTAASATSWLRLKAFTRARAAERRVSELDAERARLQEELTTLKAQERHLAQSQPTAASSSLVSHTETR